ncbi:MAG: phage/plasmid primase, P4 family, partial [Rhodoblastus sp.]
APLAAAAGVSTPENESSHMGASPKSAPAAEQGGIGGTDGVDDDAPAPDAYDGPDGPRDPDDDDAAALDRRCAFLPMTDLGNAERFFARFGQRFRYCAEIGWLAWDGRRWNPEQADAKVMLAEHETVRGIQDEAEAVSLGPDDYVVETKGPKKDPVYIMYSDKLRGWGRASEGAQKLGAISKRAAPMLQIAIAALDADPMRFNVLNGTLRLGRAADGGFVELLPHDANDLITKLAPVEYRPDAQCPLYDAFLAKVQPEREADGMVQAARFLHQWAGLSLTGETGEQRYTFHYGKGRNGKGVWVSTVAHILGDYAGSIRIESFLDSGKASSGGQATPDIAKLPGVRFLSTSEPKKGATLDEGLVKLFTGEDVISARHLNKGFFDFRPVAKLTMQGNYRPKISGTDEGIWNRTILVPWPVFIPKDERDPKLAHKLRGEASGILNRFLDGLDDWLDNGLTLPGSVQAATEDYRSDSDPLGRFLEACTSPQIGKRVQASEMHALFSAWAKANGETEWTPKGLAGALKERGLLAKKSDNVFWLDIELTKRPSDFLDKDGKPLRQGEIGPGGPGENMEREYD